MRQQGAGGLGIAAGIGLDNGAEVESKRRAVQPLDHVVVLGGTHYGVGAGIRFTFVFVTAAAFVLTIARVTNEAPGAERRQGHQAPASH